MAVAQITGGDRSELIFSQATLQLIGERTITMGKSTSATAIIQRAFAGHLGQIPPSR